MAAAISSPRARLAGATGVCLLDLIWLDVDRDVLAKTLDA
jgi:hypothetical protein